MLGDGAQLWGAQFKEPYNDVLAAPRRLADRICDPTDVDLSSQCEQGARKTSEPRGVAPVFLCESRWPADGKARGVRIPWRMLNP
jgi:hypothetical protein